MLALFLATLVIGLGLLIFLSIRVFPAIAENSREQLGKTPVTG
jgi:hypothetical protein